MNVLLIFLAAIGFVVSVVGVVFFVVNWFDELKNNFAAQTERRAIAAYLRRAGSPHAHDVVKRLHHTDPARE